MKTGNRKLINLYSRILRESIEARIQDNEYTIYHETQLFLELADPTFAYKYGNISENIWEFRDKYGNTIHVSYEPRLRFFESYYMLKTVAGEPTRVFDYDTSKEYLDPTSFQGGSDEHRSDTICKILRDEVIPKYLLRSESKYIRLHPLNKYRSQIFEKCAEVCLIQYPELFMKKVGAEIYLMKK